MLIAPRETPSAIPTPYVIPPSQQFDGNDGKWSTFKLSVGSPGQDFRVLVSTKSGETWVVVPEGCLEGDGAGCPNQRGAGIFGSTQSPGFQVNMSSTWSTIGQYQIGLEQGLNYTGQGLFGYDKVTLGAASDNQALSMDHQVVAGVAELDYWMGHIPLGVPDSSFSSLSQSIDSFIYQLRNSSKIPSISFAYTAGAKYRLKSVFGSLILGGYDSTRFTPSKNPFSFSFSTDPSRLLTVGVESITALNTLKGTYSLSSSAHFSLIDSTVSHLWLPRAICDNFEIAFGLTYDPQTDLYVVNDTMHQQLLSKNPSITIKLVNSLENTATNYTNIVLPYAAFDLQASYPYYRNATNYFPIRRAANDSQYVLGRTLLQEAYLIVDYERANFTVSQAAFPDPLPAAKIVTIQPPTNASNSVSKPNNDKSPLSTAAIAGIAAGGGFLLILILAGAIFLHRKRVGKRRKYELANTQVTEAEARSQATVAALKNQAPQELGGTPLNELLSPHDQHGRDRKPFVSPTNIPQELPTPNAPRWRDVTRHEFYEMEGASTVPSETTSRAVSRAHSQAPSDDGTGRYDGRYTGISPMTGQFQPHRLT